MKEIHLSPVDSTQKLKMQSFEVFFVVVLDGVGVK